MSTDDQTKDAVQQQGGMPQAQKTPAPKRRTGTVTLEGLQKELGDEKGLEEYLRLGESFGITRQNVVEFHPPLDLASIRDTKE